MACDSVQTVFIGHPARKTGGEDSFKRDIYVICNNPNGPFLVQYALDLPANQLRQVGRALTLGLSRSHIASSLTVEAHSRGYNYYAVINNRQAWQWAGHQDQTFYPVGQLAGAPDTFGHEEVIYNFVAGNFSEPGTPRVYLGGRGRVGSATGVFILRFRKGVPDPLFNRGQPLFLADWDSLGGDSLACPSPDCSDDSFMVAGTGRLNSGAGSRETGIWLHAYLADGSVDTRFNENGTLFLPEQMPVSNLVLQIQEQGQHIHLIYRRGDTLLWRRFDHRGLALDSGTSWQSDIAGITVTAAVVYDGALHLTGFSGNIPKYRIYSRSKTTSPDYYGVGLAAPSDSTIPTVPSVITPDIPTIPTNLTCPVPSVPTGFPDTGDTVLDALGLGHLNDPVAAWKVSLIHLSGVFGGLAIGALLGYSTKSCTAKLLAMLCCWKVKVEHVRTTGEVLRSISNQISETHAVEALVRTLSRLTSIAGGEGSGMEDIDMGTMDDSEINERFQAAPDYQPP